jgi:metal-sulfur cluster biosynthetic enzyme
MASVRDVKEALAEVLDPEYPVSLVDMGLIRDIQVRDTTAEIAISFCSLGCPCISLIEQDVRERLLQLEGIEQVELRESFEPWTRRNLSGRGVALLREAGVG